MPSPLSVSVAAGGDDCLWDSVSTFNNTGTITTFGLSGGSNFHSAFRLALAIPKSATIDSATATGVGLSRTGTVNLILAFEASDNTSAITSWADAEARRGNITSSVSWNAVPNFVAGTTYTSPDLKTSLQEVVNRAGWLSGQYVNLLVMNSSGSSSYRQFAAYEHATYDPLLLTVTYTEGGTCPVWLLRHRSNLDLGGF